MEHITKTNFSVVHIKVHFEQVHIFQMLFTKPNDLVEHDNILHEWGLQLA